jgi:DNA-binding transcriptional LysR family regulator
MELRHLRYFIAVAEELNFSRAAERLHVSEPPLSRQIRDLEAELKVKLLDRNTQRVRLTRVGYAVLARSRKLVRDAESLRAEAQMIEKEGQEELRIGYAPSPTAVIISTVLCRYHELSPGARLTLHDLTHTEMLSGAHDATQQGQADRSKIGEADTQCLSKCALAEASEWRPGERGVDRV